MADFYFFLHKVGIFTRRQTHINSNGLSPAWLGLRYLSVNIKSLFIITASLIFLANDKNVSVVVFQVHHFDKPLNRALTAIKSS